MNSQMEETQRARYKDGALISLVLSGGTFQHLDASPTSKRSEAPRSLLFNGAHSPTTPHTSQGSVGGAKSSHSPITVSFW